jgi:hypothetical protein
MLKKVISGGQTGADQAGLYVAGDRGIKIGGWAPKGFMTSVGPNLLLKFLGLKEHKGGYRDRTRENVRDSDGTIRLAVSFTSPGEKCTLNAIKEYGKPHIDVDLLNPIQPKVVAQWIIANKIKVLNVAGNTEGEYPIFDLTKKYLTKVFDILEDAGYIDFTGMPWGPLSKREYHAEEIWEKHLPIS